MRTGKLTTQNLLVVLLASSLGGCAVNPATGQREFSLVSEREEIQMGREADPQIVEALGLYPDSSVQQYVRELGDRLAAASERPSLPWTFRVLDDPTINAFALPGGYIYITRGILAHLTSEAQLVGILGHEIGHVTARHSASQMSQQQLAQIGLGVGVLLSSRVAAVSDIASAGIQVLSLKFSRDDETQADELGIRYMRRLDFDPRELGSVMRMLERSSEFQSGGGRTPEWLSTHPDPGNRVDHINGIVAAANEDLSDSRVARETFLRRIDDMVFGQNPREGFFDGNVFHHPDLRFRIDFPPGWQTANGKSAVQAVPSSEDAIFGLTIADGSPSAALDEFATLDGVTVSGSRGGEVNGLTMTRASFSATQGQTSLRGSVMFVAHAGLTFRLLGYAAPSNWSSHDAVVNATQSSFRVEEDAAVLAAQPDRVDLVTISESLALDAFVERFPSTVDARVVGLINQLESDQTFSPGALAKRVVQGG